MRPADTLKGGGGFTYVALLVVIAIIGVSTAVVSQNMRNVYKVEREKELLWKGNQFRIAIRSYYNYRVERFGAAHPGTKYFPSELRDLMLDPASPATRRYLRKMYIDPMTGKDDWVEVRGEGGIIGVHSASDAKPLKVDNFDLKDEEFRGKQRYSEWIFRFTPTQVK